MKKYFIICFFLLLCISLSANENEYLDDENFTLNVGISVLYPLDEDLPVAGNIFGAVLFSSLYVGGGYHLNILQNIFMPGIYGEVNFWLLPLLIQYLSDPDKEIEDYDSDILDVGFRVYNLFRFGLFGLQPFIGINLSILHGFS